tara:strand:- start:25 stop:327 length:303 start_codon:yes stop_codon:yes gene_type:complete
MEKPKCKCGRISTITDYKTKERLCTKCAFSNDKAKEKGVNKRIIKMIEQRLEVGKREYGSQIMVNDGRDWLDEALEEALDLAVYLSAKIIHIKEKEKRIL